jgi:hypothetical protein
MLAVEDVTFSQTPHGFGRIDFKDPVFARAEILFYDPSSNAITGLIDGVHFTFGVLPQDLTATFRRNATVFLTAPHPAGHDLVLSAQLSTLQ